MLLLPTSQSWKKARQEHETGVEKQRMQLTEELTMQMAVSAAAIYNCALDPATLLPCNFCKNAAVACPAADATAVATAK